MNLLNTKDLNFLSALNNSRERDLEKMKKTGIRFFPVALLALFLFIYIILLLTGLFKNLGIHNLQKSIDEITASSRYQAALVLQKQIADGSAYSSNLNIIRHAADTYPEITSELFQKINAAVGDAVSISKMSYTKEDGILSISGTSKDVTQTASFIERLRKSGAFISLSYTGYLIDTKEETYEFKASCLFLEPLIKDGDNK